MDTHATNIIPFLGFSEPINSWTHLLAAVAFFVLSFKLVEKGRGNGLRVFALSFFTFCLVFLFSMSGVFHLLERGTLGWVVLKRLDHAAIWTLIAGTFTPIHIILFRGFWRWGFLTIVWTLAITGLVLKTIYFNSIPEWASVGMFLALGWMGALSAWKVLHIYKNRSINYLIYGAIFYTAGALLEYWRWPVLIQGVFGPHELFHIMVILGAYNHWRWVYQWADCPVVNDLVFTVTQFPDHYMARAHNENIRIKADSLEELKEQISAKTGELFHHNLPVRSIRLQYTQEEVLA